ncbi:class I SAM-dependent methyltransferase [Pseudomonas sp. R3.Fl]|uniref:methyltransferase n=1 Tax=Pseudomonas sp. R3.Fl TaxID=2928708 RepID=UPI00201DEC40|nr:methyltransferase [Pseudomonas sp. R3.Fl]MCL6690569.1 class I SAM-dependent methyltransferase [Pseudomonas sp. R3.Fl]
MSQISQELEPLGYIYQPESRIWARSKPVDFDYSDGDETENRIHRIIAQANDISVFSRELQAACTDWPTTYHLSSARGNLLRPLERFLRAEVLEIGAGCGAITRFLGEAGGNVIAIEGSPRRAAIAAQRTRDLANVTVVNDQFENFGTTAKFDVITLIGVLEYAGKFSPSDDPVNAMLRSVKQLLKPDGILIIAIENQLGLKYLAGAPEDHLGVPRLGIQGLYENPGVETFGHVALRQKLTTAGFKNIETALPFPDYKIPASIIYPAAHTTETNFDASSLAAQVSSRDVQTTSRQVNFSLECTWREIGKNRLLPELSNSFLIAASSEEAGSRIFFESDILASHYSTNRQPAFCKSVEFIKTPSGDVLARNSLINPEAALRQAPTRFMHKLPEEAYFPGEALSTEFIRELQRPTWTAKSVAAYMRRYLSICLYESGAIPSTDTAIDLSMSVSGKHIDLIPQNILVQGKQVQIIDREWEYDGDISVAYLTFRALTTLIRMISSFAVPQEPRWLQQGRLFECVFAHLGKDFLQSDYEEFARQEADFMSFVSSIPCAPIPFNDWYQHILPSYLDHAQDLTRPLLAHLQEVESLAETYISQIKWLESENASLHTQLEDMHQAVSELKSGFEDERLKLESKIAQSGEELLAIKSSRAWRFGSRLFR